MIKEKIKYEKINILDLWGIHYFSISFINLDFKLARHTSVSENETFQNNILGSSLPGTLLAICPKCGVCMLACVFITQLI